MDDSAPPPTNPAASAAHPGRPPPSHPTSLRLTGAPPSTARRACVSSPKQIATQYDSPKHPNFGAGWSRSPLRVAALTRSISLARRPRETQPRARSCTTTTPATNQANGSQSAAATGAQLSAYRAPAFTRETPSTWSALASSAARPYPRQSATAPGSSSRSQPRPLGPCTGPGTAADRAVYVQSASTVVPSAAALFMGQTAHSSGNPSASPATTIRPTRCGTRTRASSGTALPLASGATSPRRWAWRSPASRTMRGCPSPGSPSTRSALPSTCMRLCASTARPDRTTNPRHGAPRS